MLRTLTAGLTIALFGALVYVAWVIVTDPNSPLPDEWNPTRPLDVSAPLSPWTGYKLRRAVADPELCRAVLDQASLSQPMEPLEVSETCHIRNRVLVSRVGDAALSPIETSCAIALRLAMWEKHSVQVAAQTHFGVPVQQIGHIGSFNCRPIRGSTRPSTHSTADAIDISGFRLSDGRRILLLSGWQGAADASAFLHEVRDGSCDWFATSLGPDYNALHADHFHLQAHGWGTCR